MAKKKQRTFKEYECCNFQDGLRDNYISLTKSMMLHENYLSLTPNSLKLYNYMKLWACGNKQFKYSYSLANQVIGSKTTIYRCIIELEQKGFIKRVSVSKQVGYASIYEFSDDWYKIKKT